MELRLVIGACSNEHVASWALQSLDDDLATQIHREAAHQGNCCLVDARDLARVTRGTRGERV